jgi:BMFP domain-containing protein YqiC
MNKKILLVSGLILLLLPVPRVFAYEDTSRMDILRARVNELEKKAKESDSKIKDLEALSTKISPLESRLDTNDSKVKYMVRQEAELESRVSDLEAARDETGDPGKKSEKGTAPQETQETT